MTQAFCVIHILVSGKSPEHRLSQHPDESMPAVLAGACSAPRNVRQFVPMAQPDLDAAPMDSPDVPS
jgi:hypothetical protein